ncbi:MAG: galactose mutarotase [Acidimicrobiales bacterium]|nr:MAG: galactose mutarotase [Acidimicrobiales bacterium]
MMGSGTVSVRSVGHLPTGEAVSAVELSNESMQVTLLDLGATLWTLVPQGHASASGITLAHNDPLSYATNPPYLGCTVGPLANRVGGSNFSLDGRRYELVANEGAHHLHGGPTGFGQRIWTFEIDPDAVSVVFRLHRPNGEGGYPGALDVEVLWTLQGNRLRFAWTALADQATPVSLTNHTYWNLSGTGTIEDHRLRVDAEAVVEIDDQLIPTGDLLPAQGGVFDLADGPRIGEAIDRVGLAGIDHCYALVPGSQVDLHDPRSGRRLTVETSLPGVQVYTGHQLDGSAAQGGFGPMSGLCLETQLFPDAVNNPSFLSPMLVPNEIVRHWTDYTLHGIHS